MSRAEIARRSGLSKPTVSLALARLVEAGLVRQAGQSSGGKGPSAKLYELNPGSGWVVGHRRRPPLGAGRASPTSRRHRRAPRRARPSTQRARASSPRSARSPTASPPTPASPGRRDGTPPSAAPACSIPSSGMLAHGAQPARLGPRRASSRPSATELGTVVSFENDVNLAALGERSRGSGRDVTDFVFLWVGTGVGLGIVDRRRALPGRRRRRRRDRLPAGRRGRSRTTPPTAAAGSSRRRPRPAVSSPTPASSACARRSPQGRSSRRRDAATRWPRGRGRRGAPHRAGHRRGGADPRPAARHPGRRHRRATTATCCSSRCATSCTPSARSRRASRSRSSAKRPCSTAPSPPRWRPPRRGSSAVTKTSTACAHVGRRLRIARDRPFRDASSSLGLSPPVSTSHTRTLITEGKTRGVTMRRLALHSTSRLRWRWRSSPRAAAERARAAQPTRAAARARATRRSRSPSGTAGPAVREEGLRQRARGLHDAVPVDHTSRSSASLTPTPSTSSVIKAIKGGDGPDVAISFLPDYVGQYAHDGVLSGPERPTCSGTTCRPARSRRRRSPTRSSKASSVALPCSPTPTASTTTRRCSPRPASAGRRRR